MAGAIFKIEKTGNSAAFIQLDFDTKAALAALDRVVAASGNAQPLFSEIGSDLEASTRRRFETQTAPDDTPWLPLSEQWRERKQEKGYPDSILRMRGDLLNSIAFEAGDDFVSIIAGPSDYAAVHQFGYAPGNIPGRPFLGLSAEDATKIEAAASGFLLEAFSGL